MTDNSRCGVVDMNGGNMMGSWVCTDVDTAQYCKKIDDFSWSYIEARELGTGGCVVCHAVVDLRDYTLDEAWQYCSEYYMSFEQMVGNYGFRDALMVMAECIFEQLDFDDMEFNVEKQSIGEAIMFIYEWIAR